MNKTCGIEDCGRPPRGRGWCAKHYQRWAKTGDPLKVLKEEPNRGLFIKECLIKGCTSKPHGRGLCQAHHKAHRRSYLPEYEIWQYMKNRCLNPRSKSYKNWGARGITICDRWLNDFDNFYKDMGPRPSSEHQLDRINNDSNYSPSNCRWATRQEQANNKRNNVIITAFGKTQTAAQWAREVGIDARIIRRRINRDGWTPERTLTYGAK